MGREEITAVLFRTSEIHSMICDAIDRSLKARTCNRGADDHCLNREGGEAGVATEAQSLASILDALEVLKEQLECLKALKHQQRVEKDATLAELEESREILIRRLKQHQGYRDSALIREVLLFAGEPHQELQHCSYAPHDASAAKQVKQNVGVSAEDAKVDAASSSILSKLLNFFNGRVGKMLFVAGGVTAVMVLSESGSLRSTRKHSEKYFMSTRLHHQAEAFPEKGMSAQDLSLVNTY